MPTQPFLSNRAASIFPPPKEMKTRGTTRSHRRTKHTTNTLPRKRHGTATRRSLFRKIEFPKETDFIEEKDVVVDGTTFECSVIWNPSKANGVLIKSWLAAGPDNVLGITEEFVDSHLNQDLNNYLAVLYVKNKASDDRAVATLQYATWCGHPKENVWIHDVMRLGAAKGAISPVIPLFQVAKHLTGRAGAFKLWLLVHFVSDADKENPESSWSKLTGLYSSRYKFTASPKTCKISDDNYTAMSSFAI
jgi:hypothetical protein